MNKKEGWSVAIERNINGYYGVFVGEYPKRRKVFDTTNLKKAEGVRDYWDMMLKHDIGRIEKCFEACKGDPTVVSDLLAALKTICSQAIECEMFDGPSMVDGLTWQNILDGRDAIYKAEGEVQ